MNLSREVRAFRRHFGFSHQLAAYVVGEKRKMLERIEEDTTYRIQPKTAARLREAMVIYYLLKQHEAKEKQLEPC